MQRAAPPLLPVLDLRGGRVVRACGGQRDRYRPLGPGTASDPVAVAETLARRVGHRELYVADLDGIEHGRPDLATLRRLARAGFGVRVDRGSRSPADALRALEAGAERVVAALETLPDPGALDAVLREAPAGRTAFSLDLRSASPLAAPAWPRAPLAIARRALAAGADEIVVLDLAAVGRRGGPGSLRLIERLSGLEPRPRLIAGGGVRHAEDVLCLGGAGADRVLVATALHDGTLGHVPPAERAERG